MLTAFLNKKKGLLKFGINLIKQENTMKKFLGPLMLLFLLIAALPAFGQKKHTFEIKGGNALCTYTSPILAPSFSDD
jgi:hypothetical protein